jgi:hypothetical protein
MPLPEDMPDDMPLLPLDRLLPLLDRMPEPPDRPPEEPPLERPEELLPVRPLLDEEPPVLPKPLEDELPVLELVGKVLSLLSLFMVFPLGGFTKYRQRRGREPLLYGGAHPLLSAKAGEVV